MINTMITIDSLLPAQNKVNKILQLKTLVTRSYAIIIWTKRLLSLIVLQGLVSHREMALIRDS